MHNQVFLRIWQEVNIDDVSTHLLICGNITGDCNNCREIGISLEATSCPKCNTGFKYITTRISNSTHELKRIKRKRPDLIVIDYRDFKEADARRRARGLL